MVIFHSFLYVYQRVITRVVITITSLQKQLSYRVTLVTPKSSFREFRTHIVRIYCELYSSTSKLAIQILVDIIISSEYYLDFLNIGYLQKIPLVCSFPSSKWLFLFRFGYRPFLDNPMYHTIYCHTYKVHKPQICPKMLAPMCPRKLGKHKKSVHFSCLVVVNSLAQATWRSAKNLVNPNARISKQSNMLNHQPLRRNPELLKFQGFTTRFTAQ